ncbi:MAG: hypothetical protein IKB02_05170 [Clostridia bacterium]|nr:hypothetical protein [Clostridia bacterium]
MKLEVNYEKMYEEGKQEFYSDEAIFNRRIQALKMIEKNFCLQELIADMNNADYEYGWREEQAICDYLKEKFGIKLTKDDIWDVLYERVYEDKEAEYVLWKNGISNHISEIKERGKPFGCPNSLKNLYRDAAIFFGDLSIK